MQFASVPLPPPGRVGRGVRNRFVHGLRPDTISDIASYCKPILVLSGGEPLFRPDILTIADHARSEGLRVALATNGTLVTAEKPGTSIRRASPA